MTAMKGKICRGCGREFGISEQFCPDDGSRLSTPSQVGHRQEVDPLIGQTLENRYKILRVIGEGGMGVVYEAEHVLIEKHVAIKVLRDTFTSRPDVVERFKQEAKSASKIGHPNIVDVSDFGETLSGQSYIVMEMLSGEDLADVLSRERLISPTRATRLAFQVARALFATHNKNIVHRDLKPENIYLIERDGARDVVKIVDFGVAKMSDVESPTGRRLTRTGMIFGTPEYMSPEQALGRPFDHRVDIYALGAIFYEMLTGRVPFEGENFMEILAKHGHARVPTLREANPTTQVSPVLERIVMRALSKDPDQRYSTMGELAAELRAAPEMPSLDFGDVPDQPVWAVTSAVPLTASVAQASADDRADTQVRSKDQHQAEEPAAADSLAASSAPPIAVPITRDSSSWQAWLADASASNEASAAATRARRARKLWWAAAAIIAVSVGAGYGWRNRSDPGVKLASLAPVPAAPEATSLPAQPPQPSAPLAQVETPVAAADPTPSDPIEMVDVRVRTNPRGARVRVLGTDLQCPAAPCVLTLPRGRQVTLRAETKRGSVEQTATFDSQSSVALRLGSIARAPRITSGIQTASDLKVPAIFRGATAHSR